MGWDDSKGELKRPARKRAVPPKPKQPSPQNIWDAGSHRAAWEAVNPGLLYDEGSKGGLWIERTKNNNPYPGAPFPRNPHTPVPFMASVGSGGIQVANVSTVVGHFNEAQQLLAQAHAALLAGAEDLAEMQGMASAMETQATAAAIAEVKQAADDLAGEVSGDMGVAEILSGQAAALAKSS